jgi:hypothetical protein
MTTSQRGNVYTYLNTLLSQDQVDRAIKYAQKQQVIEPAHGLPEIRAWLASVEQERAERKAAHEANAAIREAEEYRKSKEYAEEEVLTVALEPVQELDGWPAEAEAEVYSKCKNPRMVVIAFEGGRTASMWKMGRNHKVGARVKVKLVEYRVDDPLYEEVRE